MSLSAVLQPAIDMAWNGIRVDLHTHEAMVRLSDYLDEHPEDVPKFREIARIYLKDGKPYAVGDKLKQQDLAKSLRLLADGGSETFYKGVIAKRIIDDMQTQLGPMSAQDLAGYQIRVRKPLKGVYRGYEVIGMPPPSSGGACLMQALNVMEGYDPKTVAPADYYHALAESMKHAFADRASFLGDEDHHPEVAEDVRKMLSPAHAGKIREAILKDETRPAKDYGIHGLNDDSGTTHYSIVDSKGNAVAATETINLAFGSFVVPAGTGIVMNNELDDFAVKTGVANEFGLMMSERNRIKPGQRPLSSMSPTLLLKDGKAVLAAGASGGPKIITATLQAILQIVDFGKTPDAAVAAPRIHHQWSPNKIRYEEGIGPEIASALTARGHEMEAYSGSAAGVCQAVYVKDGHLYGASDPRKGGRPAGK
jgi:gamma-glutamyltranspeptidase/glutathione hydrolase